VKEEGGSSGEIHWHRGVMQCGGAGWGLSRRWRGHGRLANGASGGEEGGKGTLLQMTTVATVLKAMGKVHMATTTSLQCTHSSDGHGTTHRYCMNYQRRVP
jgi:hypothetical protein